MFKLDAPLFEGMNHVETHPVRVELPIRFRASDVVKPLRYLTRVYSIPKHLAKLYQIAAIRLTLLSKAYPLKFLLQLNSLAVLLLVMRQH